MIKTNVVVVVGLVLMGLTACTNPQVSPSPQSFDGKNVIVVTHGGPVEFQVEIADNRDEREVGLMYRTDLPADQGMLFVFEKPQPVSFWMKNTRIPLDMLFISADKKIASIQKNVPPCKADPCGSYPSRSMVKYVLELNGGMSDSKDINVGDAVEFSL